MAQMFEFKKVTVGPRALTARVELAPDAPLMTSEDPNAIDLILGIMPGLSDHVCLGDAAPTFGEVIYDTELAHLLEHVSVELLAQSNIAGDIARGQTQEAGERVYEITLGCPDDVLVAGALSSAAWILQWAFSGGGDPEPNVEATVGGLVALVEDLCASEAEARAQAEAELEAAAEAAAAEAELVEDAPSEEFGEFGEFGEDYALDDQAAETVDQFGEDEVAEAEQTGDLSPEDSPAPSAETASAPNTDDWDMGDIPRPHLVR